MPSLREEAQALGGFKGRKSGFGLGVLNGKAHFNGVMLESFRSAADQSHLEKRGKKMPSSFPKIKHLNQTDFILLLSGLQLQKMFKKNLKGSPISHIPWCNSFCINRLLRWIFVALNRFIRSNNLNSPACKVSNICQRFLLYLKILLY